MSNGLRGLHMMSYSKDKKSANLKKSWKAVTEVCKNGKASPSHVTWSRKENSIWALTRQCVWQQWKRHALHSMLPIFYFWGGFLMTLDSLSSCFPEVVSLYHKHAAMAIVFQYWWEQFPMSTCYTLGFQHQSQDWLPVNPQGNCVDSFCLPSGSKWFPFMCKFIVKCNSPTHPVQQILVPHWLGRKSAD